MQRAKARLLAKIAGEAPAEDEDGEPLAGRYRLRRRLGAGGMGEVYEAEDTTTGRTVAVKRMRPDVARHEATRRRFLREAKTAAALDHPNIVRVLDVGEDAHGRPFLVMEHVEGRTLAERIEQDGPLSWAEAGGVFRPVAHALAYAHAAGVVHRDLKPSNIMLRASDGAPVVIDFGLARREVLDSATMSLSRTGEVLGSPPYMSPEQFRGADVDARTDQYAFGCILYEALTGRRPFEGSDVAELMYGHLFVTPPPPEGIEAPAKVASALGTVVQRCLRKRPDDRFEGFSALAAVLDRIDVDPTPVPLPADRPPAPPGREDTGRRRLRWLWPLAVGAGAGGVYLAVAGSEPAASSAPSPPGPGAPSAEAAPVSAPRPAPSAQPTPAPPPPARETPTHERSETPAPADLRSKGAPPPAPRPRPGGRKKKARRKHGSERRPVPPTPNAGAGLGSERPGKAPDDPPRPAPADRKLPPNPFGPALP